MSVVAIIGAGDPGGVLAARLASPGRVREVRLIAAAGGVAAGEAGPPPAFSFQQLVALDAIL